MNFVEANRRISWRLTPAYIREANTFAMYVKVAQLLLSRPDVETVVDVGAGRKWQFPAELKQHYGLKLIGIDVDADEIALNDELDESIVADAMTAWPVVPGSVDLVMCHSGVEHFADNRAFLSAAYTALRPGGYAVMQFPSPWAPFAILNRLLPTSLTRWLLHNLIPGSDGVLGFKAHYNRTRYAPFARLAQSEGLEIDYHYPGYFSADYFGFFVPLYFLAHGFDLFRFALGSRNLASYNLFVLRKPVAASGAASPS